MESEFVGSLELDGRFCVRAFGSEAVYTLNLIYKKW
jgi:hypothetical protein